MRKGEIVAYKGRVLRRVREGYVTIYKKGEWLGWSNSMENAKKAIDERERKNAE